ncbi:AraC-like DNA-binding protein [Mariniflexile fucanivorans]|uniref:AraC-like DNA-binding protein n=1 Tax=Mariniflexile fucanivorans TaxID=264023 RepID=A0A4R1RNR9_9FLAO|nr:AraC family transcriptional regulator [Mariniflexile fucanivorans]TCL67864.1 AraC-like DNA-binding protein [Mariniflexile fucanivorans]
MKDPLLINFEIGKKTVDKLTKYFNGSLKTSSNEYRITFNNNIGNGSITLMLLGQGMSFISFDVYLLEAICFETIFNKPVPIDFLFLTSGKISFNNKKGHFANFESYQNVIIRYRAGDYTSYKMACGIPLQLNIIQICPIKYFKKYSKHKELLTSNLNEILGGKSNKMFYHFGNFNLKIADYIRQLNNCNYSGMIKQITAEGIINIILGLQLWEYENYNEKFKCSTNLNCDDIAKIEKATDYIKEHVHENLTVNKLASKVHLSSPKLQKGFKLLYRKTVNNYIKEIKLQTAHNYLENSNLTVSEVVYKVGYNSRSYFTQIFFQRFGILPSQYIKKLK